MASIHKKFAQKIIKHCEIALLDFLFTSRFKKMKPLAQLPSNNIKYVFTDIDDTITTDGKLSAEAYSALWKLKEQGYIVVPITGRPAGWCDMIARFWPVDAVIGENGAFYFRYNDNQKKMSRVWAYDEAQRIANQKKLAAIEKEVLQKVQGCAISADQFCRLFDLAIDFCEDVPPLAKSDIQQIVQIFESHGATAKVSSIHVNGWFGKHDKLSMCKIYMANEWSIDLQKDTSLCVFIGDSPNDEPLFSHFKNSVGVANILAFKDQLNYPPQYICTKKSGLGFVEMCEHLERAKKS